MRRLRLLTRLGAVLLGLSAGALSAQPVTDRVVNTATLTFGPDEARRVVASNTVSLDVQRTKRPTTFSFRLLPRGHALTGLTCRTSPTVEFTPAPIDAATLTSAPVLDTLDIHTPLIIVIDNQGDNRDPLLRETVTIDVEIGRAHV